ncbi:MAG: T9SS type A sorting domain-containing protein [Bacteroidales bacterium]|nr:T9SS type A sorting domain-containing protein [Bacteroidales bacterium]
MRKVLLTLLICSFGVVVFAQQRAVPSKQYRNIMLQKEYTQPVKGTGSMDNQILPAYKNANFFTEEEIGKTQYDLQTNQMTQNRVYLFDDGTIGATWTQGFDPPSWNLRGTGYNYFDGTAWGPIPTDRIEDEWSGWPSYVPVGEDGEAVASHSYVDGILYYSRPTKGTGAWTEGLIAGPAGAEDLSWPRMWTSGVNREIVHVISVTYVTYNGQANCLLYARSEDGGNTWPVINQPFPDLDASNYTEIGGDNYAVADLRNGTCAFIVGDQFMDLVLMKSTNDGDTWQKSIVWEHPYPMWDWNTTITDTFYCNDGSAAIALDNTGKAHITFGLSRVMHLEAGTTYNYFPFVDGVVYWNEDMAPFSNHLHALDPYGHPSSELIEDVNLVGWSQDVDQNGTVDLLSETLSYRTIGLSTMSNVTVDEAGNVFLAYASSTEGYDNGTVNYKHIWVRARNVAGEWQNFLDLDEGLVHIFDECIYPTWSPTSDNNNVYMIYNIDADPGLGLDDDHPFQENREFFIAIDKSELNITSGAVETEKPNFRVSQNYPNPFGGMTTVYVVLDEPSTMALEVHNMMGQLVYSIPARDYSAGKNELMIDGREFSKGVYFYTISVGSEKVTRKMIVE